MPAVAEGRRPRARSNARRTKRSAGERVGRAAAAAFGDVPSRGPAASCVLSGARPAVAAAIARRSGVTTIADGGAALGSRARSHAPVLCRVRAAARHAAVAACRCDRRRRLRDLGGEHVDRMGRRAALARRRSRAPIRSDVRALGRGNGGHATLFRAADKRAGAFASARRDDARDCTAVSKATFDPRGISQPRPAAIRTSERRLETALADFIRDTPEGREADAILRSCVHCGFCTATCPTYQLLGDELDGPRGRIYLIKQVLEGARGHRQDAAASRSLPHVPQLRDDVSVGRPVRSAARHRAARSSTSDVPRTAAGAGGALDAARTPAVARRCSAARLRLGRAGRSACCRAELARPDPDARSRQARGRAPRHAAQDARAEGCVQPRAGAEHRRRDGARSRPHRHLAAACRRRLLRRAAPSPERATTKR